MATCCNTALPAALPYCSRAACTATKHRVALCCTLHPAARPCSGSCPWAGSITHGLGWLTRSRPLLQAPFLHRVQSQPVVGQPLLGALHPAQVISAGQRASASAVPFWGGLGKGFVRKRSGGGEGPGAFLSLPLLQSSQGPGSDSWAVLQQPALGWV